MAGYRYRALSDSELASYATGEQRIECDLRSIMNAAHAFRAGHGSSFPSSWEALFSDPGSRAQLPDARSSIKDPWGHAYHYKSGLSAAWIELYTLGRDDREGGSDQDADHVLIADGDSPAVYAGTLR